MAAADPSMKSPQASRQWLFGTWAVLAALGLLPAAANAAESYFVVLFASQKHDGTNPAHFAHSFGTFVKVTTGDRPDQQRVEAFTLSWMPQTMEVHTIRLRPEEGVNVELLPTLAWARDCGALVSMWGPYQIEKELYDRAVCRYWQLQSGGVKYKAIDTGYRTAAVSNCIHALSDISFDTKRLRIGTMSWGDAASYFIALSFRAWIIGQDEVHDWLLPCLGLAGQPVIRRDLWHNPTERPVVRAIQNVAHWHMLKHVKQ